MQNIYASEVRTVDQLDVDSRATFIVRTYTNLLGAILAFTLIEFFLFSSGVAASIAAPLMKNWLIVLGAFMLVSWLGSRAAATAKSMVVQYLALAAFVAVEALIFVPLLYIANGYADGVISSAAAITLTGFGVLTFIAFWTRKDFSFQGGMLRWIAIGALIAIVASMFFSFALGTWFTVAMILFAGAAVLYDTSNVIHHYPEDRYVAASLQLFASVALMFFYVLQLLLSFTSRD
ncbi:MAG: permease [Planctomycetes bacterium]|nr:permease [Planctomycetota bacterium]